eukprot:GHVL01039423.1.p2 GENE.GHVL01039423.1~~GHVL01039423.1.p2  ORF type:complete len:105 (+),score=15.24 GHVL01039423.1:375-689(+)
MCSLIVLSLSTFLLGLKSLSEAVGGGFIKIIFSLRQHPGGLVGSFIKIIFSLRSTLWSRGRFRKDSLSSPTALRGSRGQFYKDYFSSPQAPRGSKKFIYIYIYY